MHKQVCKRASVAIALLIACCLPAQAQQRIEGKASTIAPSATTDPLKILYWFPGATDNGGAASVGVATVVICSNFSQVTEKVQVFARTFSGSVAGTVQFLNVPTRNTRAFSSHFTNLYFDDIVLNTGTLDQGLMVVSASTDRIVCTAQVVDAAAAVPNGIDLHGVRFAPVPGTQE